MARLNGWKKLNLSCPRFGPAVLFLRQLWGMQAAHNRSDAAPPYSRFWELFLRKTRRMRREEFVLFYAFWHLKTHVWTTESKMPRAKRTKKFASMKRMISLSDPRIKVRTWPIYTLKKLVFRSTYILTSQNSQNFSTRGFESFDQTLYASNRTRTGRRPRGPRRRTRTSWRPPRRRSRPPHSSSSTTRSSDRWGRNQVILVPLVLKLRYM